MAGERADLVFTDPPYNVAIDGNVCGLGSVKRREFAFASGEMSEDQFTTFLTDTLSNISRVMRDGAIAFVCMDWRHMVELTAAGSKAFIPNINSGPLSANIGLPMERAFGCQLLAETDWRL